MSRFHPLELCIQRPLTTAGSLLSFVGLVRHRSPESQHGKCFTAWLKGALTTRSP